MRLPGEQDREAYFSWVGHGSPGRDWNCRLFENEIHSGGLPSRWRDFGRKRPSSCRHWGGRYKVPPGGELREVKANVLKEELSVGFMKMSQSSNHLKVREHQWRSFVHSLIHSFLIKDLCYMLGMQGFPCFGYIHTADTDTCSWVAKGWQTVN